VRQRVAQVHQVNRVSVLLWVERLAVRVAVLAQMVLQPIARLAVLLLFRVLQVLLEATQQVVRAQVVVVRQ
jgi:hypothetical protein